MCDPAQAPLVRFRTGQTVVQLTRLVQGGLGEVRFPFLVLHDPEDQVCRVDGTERLIAESATPAAQKRYVQMHGALHALLPNRAGDVLSHMIEWVESSCAQACL